MIIHPSFISINTAKAIRTMIASLVLDIENAILSSPLSQCHAVHAIWILWDHNEIQRSLLCLTTESVGSLLKKCSEMWVIHRANHRQKLI